MNINLCNYQPWLAHCVGQIQFTVPSWGYRRHRDRAVREQRR